MTEQGNPRGAKVGLAGLGRMGRAMARNLAGEHLLDGVYNRTPEISRALAAELGVQAHRTAADLAERSDILVTVVSDADAIQALYGGPDGFLPHLRAGTLCVEMSTIGPDAVRNLRGALEPVGCDLIDAPVSGSTAMAEAAELTILVGGSLADVARARPVLEVLGSRILHVGPLGCGAVMKLAVNNLIYALNQSVSESLALAERAGIERHLAYEAFANSAAAAPFIDYRRAHFERPGEEPVQMTLQLAAKDLELIVGVAERVGAKVPQARTNCRVLLAAAADGYGAADVSAVAAYLRERAKRESS